MKGEVTPSMVMESGPLAPVLIASSFLFFRNPKILRMVNTRRSTELSLLMTFVRLTLCAQKCAVDPVQASIPGRPQQCQLLCFIFPLLAGDAVKEDEGRGHAINGNGERAVVARIDLFILPMLPKSKEIADGEPAEVHGRVVADPYLPSIGMALAGREIALGAVDIILVSLVISGKRVNVQCRDLRTAPGK